MRLCVCVSVHCIVTVFQNWRDFVDRFGFGAIYFVSLTMHGAKHLFVRKEKEKEEGEELPAFYALSP